MVISPLGTGRASPGIQSTRIVSAGVEVIFAFGGFEDVGAGFERAHQAGDGSLGDFTQASLQLAWRPLWTAAC
jgi:hypothetical protein